MYPRRARQVGVMHAFADDGEVHGLVAHEAVPTLFIVVLDALQTRRGRPIIVHRLEEAQRLGVACGTALGLAVIALRLAGLVVARTLTRLSVG